MIIEITGSSCGDVIVEHDDVVLTRRLPSGSGALTYPCRHCGSLVCVPLSSQDVMAAVFAGARAIDIESAL